MDEMVKDISKYLRFLVHRIGCSDLLPVLNVGSYPEIFCLHEHNWMNSRDFLLFCCCLHLVPVCCSNLFIRNNSYDNLTTYWKNEHWGIYINQYLHNSDMSITYYSTQVNDDNSIATLCKEGNLLCYINQ